MAKAAAFLAGAASALLAVWLRQRQRRHFLSGQELKKKSLRDGRQLVLRGATLADVEAVFELCVRRLAIEHDALDELQTTVEAFARAFAAGKFHLLVAEIDGALAGAATYQYSYRTWSGESLYLQDLYVAAAHRGEGIGTQLIRGLAAVAVASDCDRMLWESHVGKARANVFYGSTVGAETVAGEHQLLRGARRCGPRARAGVAGGPLRRSAPRVDDGGPSPSAVLAPRASPGRDPQQEQWRSEENPRQTHHSPSTAI